MASVEDHFTVFIRLPFNRADFVDPPAVSWSASKDRELWDVISRQSKDNDIDWNELARKLDVTPHFLLQQAAWLYERQLSQVRAQMRKVAGRQSATPSPTPSSLAGSVVMSQAPKQVAGTSTRVPPRLSTQTKTGSIGSGSSTPGTPVKGKTSLLQRGPSGLLGSQFKSPPPTSAPMSRQSSKEAQTPVSTTSRKGSVQPQVSRSPAHGRVEASDSASSDENVSASRVLFRRPNPSATPRRSITRRDKEARRSSLGRNEDDDEDSPPFLPFAGSGESKRRSWAQQDPGATLRGGFAPATSQRPVSQRRSTSERVVASTSESGAHRAQQMTSSNSSASSGPAANTSGQPGTNQNRRQNPTPNPLSAQQQAALAALSPRRRPASGREGGDTSPSMGSSFSDLDDASVTQSALEEALMSNMARGNSNASSNGGAAVGMASRVSGISQALRSRYFEAQSQAGR